MKNIRIVTPGGSALLAVNVLVNVVTDIPQHENIHAGE